ncbi:DUF6882 domain-containing protein [Zavarzinella formosa]|uniref:DUF6882 domain-containing protein n=1 Tax=Zavarzinella formosa TaxID=360055 RepID=UPI00037161AE|nr:DUF6882 domain-containing protein [Zavarzinella formosa]
MKKQITDQLQLNITNLYCCQAAISLANQMFLAILARASNWRFDFASGQLSFDNQYRWHSQVLGTESFESNTWLWAWANEASNIPASLVGSAHVMRMLGEVQGFPELTEPEVSLDRIDGHTIAMIASSVCQANAYYRCPYEGGALYVLIMDDNFPKDPTPPLARLATVFPQAISSLDIPDHRLALTGYLDYHGLAYEQIGDRVVAKENGEPALTATFDHLNRLTNLEATIKPRSET